MQHFVFRFLYSSYTHFAMLYEPYFLEDQVMFFTGTGWFVRQLENVNDIYTSNKMFAVDIINRLEYLVKRELNLIRQKYGDQTYNEYKQRWLSDRGRIGWCGTKNSMGMIVHQCIV